MQLKYLSEKMEWTKGVCECVKKENESAIQLLLTIDYVENLSLLHVMHKNSESFDE